MRHLIEFSCQGEMLIGSIDDASSLTGLLIVSGGNEIRAGAHRGMAMLAADIAGQGFPVFRFDRRGIGDSTGTNGEFTSSGYDIASAISTFKEECGVQRIVAFGNCDAASALILHPIQGVDHAVLGNIWVIERTDDLPPPVAIKAHYLERMRDPKAWLGLFTGAIDVKKLAKGLFRLAKPEAPSPLADQVAAGMARFPGSLTIILADRDPTAMAFAEAWKTPIFDAVRSKPNLSLRNLNSNSHSFAQSEDYRVLREALLDALGKKV